MLDQLFVSLKDGLFEIAARFLPAWAMTVLAVMFPIAVIAAIAPAIMMYFTWIERKLIARMQNRFGPTRVGLYGLAQPLADGLKMLVKEDVVPRHADKLLHTLAPIVALIPAILLFAVIPFGRRMVAADLNIGLLYILAISSISAYAIFMGGWASRSKFPMLGAMRAVAQIISYEVPGVLSVAALIMVTGTLSLVGIVEAQQHQWFICTPWGLTGFVIFFLSGVAEVNRTPFDMPEAESELVAGFHTEYSGMKFALWYMAEFMNVFTVSALTATLFLGGYQGPGLPSWAWFMMKTYALVFVMMWFRGTLPRLRVDQLMGLAWKFLLPLALINILVTGIWFFIPDLRLRLGVSIGILGVSFGLLVFLNRPYVPEKRVYQFAE